MPEIHSIGSSHWKKYTKRQLLLLQIQRNKIYEKSAIILAKNEISNQREKEHVDEFFLQELDDI